MTQEEEAKKAWREHQGWFETAVGTYYTGVPHGRNVLSDYKAALRAEIEKYFHNAMKEKAHQYNGGLIDAYKTCLELLDTVKPLKP